MTCSAQYLAMRLSAALPGRPKVDAGYPSDSEGIAVRVWISPTQFCFEELHAGEPVEALIERLEKLLTTNGVKP